MIVTGDREQRVDQGSNLVYLRYWLLQCEKASTGERELKAPVLPPPYCADRRGPLHRRTITPTGGLAGPSSSREGE